jgi:hypothetical protein
LIIRLRGFSLIATVIGIGWTAEAHAQRIPEFVAGLVLSPAILIVLSIVFAIVTKSWRLGLTSILVVVFWVTWFILASLLVASDTIIWAPIIGLGTHLVVLVVFLGWRLLSKVFRLDSSKI